MNKRKEQKPISQSWKANLVMEVHKKSTGQHIRIVKIEKSIEGVVHDGYSARINGLWCKGVWCIISRSFPICARCQD